MADARKQLNLRVDDEFLAAIGEIQRLDVSEPTTLSMTEAVRKAVIAARDRLRRAAERRK